MSGSRRDPAAQSAFDRAQACHERGDLAAALKLFEYAQRLAPSDGEITLAIGATKSALGDLTASEAFELVARRDDFREAWLALAAVRLRAGFPDLAEKELIQVLSRQGMIREKRSVELCDRVTRSNGHEGWCGISNDGRLTVTLLEAKADLRQLAAYIDGVHISCRVDRKSISHFPLRVVLQLPDNWRSGRELEVQLAGGNLLGSPLSISAITRVEGFVTTYEGGLRGWAWFPSDPDLDPKISVCPLEEEGRILTLVASNQASDVWHPKLFARPRGFAVPAKALRRFEGPVAVLGPNGRNLYGSPLNPRAEIISAAAAAAFSARLFPASSHKVSLPNEFPTPAVPADIVGPPPTIVSKQNRGVDVIIPVYRGVGETLACIESVLATISGNTRCVVVEDASPDVGLIDALVTLARQGSIVLQRQPRNRGFPATANAGMRLTDDRDVVLLNSDTLVPPDWLDRLREAALSARDIGTATPLSNDATILSYPNVDQSNPIPDLAATQRLDALAKAANGKRIVDIPTGVGFCMYIRRECLDMVGLLREDVFAQGYGEENDFCIRARHLGWRHVGVPGVFVGHVGGQSFGAAKAHLIERNLKVLNRLHPGYDSLIAAFQKQDPLAECRRRMDIARWRAERARQGSAILITHNRGGGVRRRVRERCEALVAEGFRPIVLSPSSDSSDRRLCRIGNGLKEEYPNLNFVLPKELNKLCAFLKKEKPKYIEVHHFIGHDRSLWQLPSVLNLQYDVVVHDYAWFCPRINLVGVDKRYCGEPGLKGCEVCVSDLGTAIESDIRPTQLLERSAIQLNEARQVIFPAADVARRFSRYFPGIRSSIVPWEDDACLMAAPVPIHRNDPIRVCIVGAIGVEKGFECLLGCARDVVARNLPLRFTVVGYTCDDKRLLDTGVVTITGRYEEGEAVGLIKAQKANFGLLPSLWPETWSYTLSQMWEAGLWVAAFNFGAPADRIRRTGRGWVLPLALSPTGVNNTLIDIAKSRDQFVNNSKISNDLRISRIKHGNTNKKYGMNFKTPLDTWDSIHTEDTLHLADISEKLGSLLEIVSTD